MKVKIILSLCASFLAAYMLVSVLPVNGEEQIYSDMIRLHVIANSDTDEDQALKLKVRDAVLETVEKMELPEDKEQSEKVISDNRDTLKESAERVIEENGYDYSVNVELGVEEYPEREYDGFVLPAGEYTSLRVIIGEGEGHNWWCVLYPPLCKTAAEDREEVFVAAGFSEEQYRTITQTGKTKYKIKFKILEVLEELFD
ncbi:MAG: stage II sporulation protein R [Clostridia bacterium]|nr:stage II sporulation protein R [Clostridia bacterium]